MTNARDSQPTVWDRHDAQFELNGMSGDADYARAKTLGPHIVRTVVFFVLILTFMLFWAIGLSFSTVSALMSQLGGKHLDFGPTVDTGLSILGLCGMFGFGVAWFISLFIPIREYLGEGGVLLRDAAGQRDQVYGSIKRLVDQRCPPFTSNADELNGIPTLSVSSPREWALIVTQQIGPDLRIGWTMWRSRSTAALVGDVFSGPREDDPRLLDANSCSAMRELLHYVIAHSAKNLAPQDNA